jgi:hypothetical protein
MSCGSAGNLGSGLPWKLEANLATITVTGFVLRGALAHVPKGQNTVVAAAIRSGSRLPSPKSFGSSSTTSAGSVNPGKPAITTADLDWGMTTRPFCIPYGTRQVWHQLRREGVAVAKCTVERLIHARKPGPEDGLIHHSDRGTQGGFNLSSQHPALGGCNEGSQAGVGWVHPAQDAIAWPATSLAA